MAEAEGEEEEGEEEAAAAGAVEAEAGAPVAAAAAGEEVGGNPPADDVRPSPFESAEFESAQKEMCAAKRIDTERKQVVKRRHS